MASKKPERKIIVPQPTVVDVVAPEISQPTTPEPVVVEETKQLEAQPIESVLTKTLPNEEVIRYENARFKYGFDISKKVYYSGFGAQ